MTSALENGRAPWGAIVLAAGGSVRMGRPKQLIEIEGRALVARAADAALEAGLWPVAVVVGAHADEIRVALARLPVLCAENAAWPEGMASSLRAGVATLEQFSRHLAGTLIALCDQPAFGAGTIRTLTRARTESGRGIAAARYQGHLGAPALFDRRYFAELAQLTGDEGARVLFQRHAADVAAADLPELAIDLDTPEDYQRWSALPPRR